MSKKAFNKLNEIRSNLICIYCWISKIIDETILTKLHINSKEWIGTLMFLFVRNPYKRFNELFN